MCFVGVGIAAEIECMSDKFHSHVVDVDDPLTGTVIPILTNNGEKGVTKILLGGVWNWPSIIHFSEKPGENLAAHVEVHYVMEF